MQIRKTSTAGAALLALALAACTGEEPPVAETPAETAPPEPSVVAAREDAQTICPLIRYEVAGRPADPSGQAVQNAKSALTQAMRERGYEVVNTDKWTDDFQNRAVNIETNFNDLDENGQPLQRQITAAQINENVRERIRAAMLMTLDDLGTAELANCNWLLTGQVEVGQATTNPSTGRPQANVQATLDIVDAFDRRSVGSAYCADSVGAGDREQLAVKGLTYSLECATDTVTSQVNEARTLYTVNLPEFMTGRAGFQLQEAFAANGFEVRDVVLNGFTTRYEGPFQEMQRSLNSALDQVAARYPDIDYELKGRLISIDAAPSA